MKRLKHIVNRTIWSLLGLYVLLLVVIHLPVTQRYLGEVVAGAIGKKLNTEVTVGRVDLGFFNRIIVDDVHIRDQQGQQMIHANRMTVKIDLLPLLDGSIRISSAQLFGLEGVFYRETASSAPNYQFVLDALKSEDKQEPSKLDVRVNSIIIRHSSVRYDQRDAERTAGLFNTNHLYVSDISAYVQIKTLTQDSLDVNIKRFTCKEQSGLQIDRLGLHLTAGADNAQLSNFELLTPHTQLRIPLLAATFDRDSLQETIAFQGSIDDTSVTPSDFAPLFPTLSSFNHSYALTTAFSGTARSLNLQQLSLRSDDSSLSLLATGSYDKDAWHAQIAHLALSGSLVADVRQSFPDVPDILERLGDITVNGTANGTPASTQAALSVNSRLGQIDSRLTYGEDSRFDGELTTEGINLRELLQNDRLGLLATQLHLSGTPEDIRAEGTISRLDYNDYSYQDITLDGSYRQGDIAGTLTVSDPNIQTDIEGELHLADRTAVRLTGSIDRLSPARLNLTDKWGDATFSALINAQFSASSLNDAEGTIDLDEFHMTKSDSVRHDFHLDNLRVKSGYEDDIHYVKVKSDFGEAELNGQFDLATLPQSFINYIGSKLPTLPDLPQSRHPTDNNFMLTVRLTDSEWIEKMVGIPLDFRQQMELEAVVDDQQRTIDIDAAIPAFTYQGDEYRNAQIKITTEDDTTHCRLNLTKMTTKGRQTDLLLTARAGDNTIRSAIQFNNHDGSNDPAKSVNGVINAIAQLYSNEQQKPEAQVRIMPSHLMMQGTQWNLEPCVVLYSDKRLMLDHFNLHHQDQHLIADGVASASSNDSIKVDLRNIDIEYILDLVNFRSVRFGGLATGQACLTEVFGDSFNAWTELTVDDFTFVGGPMGTLSLNAYWNQDMKRIDLHAVADAGSDAQTYINGYVSPSDKDLDINIVADGSPIAFCHTFTQSFLRELSGHAYGELRVVGPLKHINLVGDMAVQGVATVGALGTTYTLRGDTIHFTPNEISFDGFHIFDGYDHTARIYGGIHHHELKNFTFDIDIDADQVLAYDFPDFGQSTICGTVFATGTAQIKGRPGEVIINCDVTPERNSSFAYNAANPDAISQQQFITWGDRDNREVSLLSPIAPKIPSDLRINFRINATPDATLRVLIDASSGDAITLQGNGVINAAFYNKGPFQMFGTYTVERGTYGMTIQNIIRKNFNFQEGGTIIFGGNPFDAALNLNAVYTVNGVSLSDLQLGNSFTNNTVRVNCLMNILGTAGAPRVEFDLEMPNVNAEEQQMIRSIIASEQELNQQVIYLLGIGRFYTQGANNAGTQQYGQTELAMQSFLSGTVSTQINEVLSQVIKTDDWNFGANISTGNEGWHNAEYEGLVSGRMLNNRLLINGQFGYRDNATQATPSFIGDFDIRYLLNPNGNLALKVYNQTNDRYFTRSSLNTQGVGIIMKKDFNGLGDLFRRKK